MTTNKGAANTAAPTAADHANTIREALDGGWHPVREDGTRVETQRHRDALAALDALQHRAETAEELSVRLRDQRNILLDERDAAVQAAEQHRAALADEMGLTEQQRARAEAAEQAAEQARAALQEWARRVEAAGMEVPQIVRAALAGNQP